MYKITKKNTQKTHKITNKTQNKQPKIHVIHTYIKLRQRLSKTK